MTRALLSPILGLSFTLSLGLACDVQRAAGEKCENTKGCMPGLVCANELCADGAKITKKRAERIQELVQTYMHENEGKCPGTIASVTPGNPILDAWEQEFEMACPGERFVVDVISKGPDGQSDTADDIYNVDESLMGGAAPGE